MQADKLFRIDGAEPAVLHLELEANPRSGIPRDLMRYNTLVDHQHGLPVETVLILLRPKALVSEVERLSRNVRCSGLSSPVAAKRMLSSNKLLLQ